MNDSCRSCDSLEAQLAQLRDMAKQSSGQQQSERVLSPPFESILLFLTVRLF